MTCSNSSNSNTSSCCETLDKFVYEEKWFSIDCSTIIGEEAIEESPGPVLTSEKYNGNITDLVIDDISVVDGNTIRFFVTGGSKNTRYKITAQFETDGGQKLQGIVILKVL